MGISLIINNIMGSNAKITIVCLNIFLLTIQISHAVPNISTTSLSSEDQTQIVTTTGSIENLDITTAEDALNNYKQNTSNDTSNIDSDLNSERNDNTSDSLSTTTDKNDFIDPQTLEKLLHEDVEIDDLQHGGNFENIPKTIDEDDEVILPSIIDNDVEAPRWETEWIEDADSQEEEIPPIINVIAVDSKEQVEYVFEGHIIGIVVATTLIILLVTGYVALISWRRFILNRYGSRQILVNEEDMIIDPNDMKHFSL